MRSSALFVCVLILAILAQTIVSQRFDEELRPPPRPEPRRPSGGSQLVTEPSSRPSASDSEQVSTPTSVHPSFIPAPTLPTPPLASNPPKNLFDLNEHVIQLAVVTVLMLVAGVEMYRSARSGNEVLQQKLQAALSRDDFITSAALLQLGVSSSKDTDSVRGTLLKHLPLNQFDNPSVGELQGYLHGTSLLSRACFDRALEFHQTVAKQQTSSTLRLTGPGPSHLLPLSQSDPLPAAAATTTTTETTVADPLSVSACAAVSTSTSTSTPLRMDTGSAHRTPGPSSSLSPSLSTAHVEDLSDSDDSDSTLRRRARRATLRHTTPHDSVEFPEDRQRMVSTTEGELLVASSVARLGLLMEVDLEMKMETKRQQDALYLLEVVRAKHAVEERQRELEKEIELTKDTQLRRLVLLAAVIHGLGPFVRMVLLARDPSSQVCLIPELNIPAFLPLIEGFSTSSQLCFSVPNRSYFALFLWSSFAFMRLLSFATPYQPLVFSAALALLGVHSIVVALFLICLFALVLYILRIASPHLLFSRPWLTVATVLALSSASSSLLHPYIARLIGSTL